MILVQGGGAVAGGLVGYRVGGRVGAVVGAVLGAVGAPRVLDAVVGTMPAAAATLPNVTAGAIEDQIRIGRAVKRPSVQDAIVMLRPTLALYGSRALASAALANAYAESRLDPLAGGDVDARGVPQAIGLFQLHSGGAGKGMSIADRVDPIRATRRILEEAAAAGLPGAAPGASGGLLWETFTNALPGSTSTDDAVGLAALTARFTVEVERPAQAGLRAAERVALLRTDAYLRQVLTGLGLPVL